MKLAAFALSALASLGLAGTASAHPPAYVRPGPVPGVSLGVVTPGGFSFGYSNVTRPGWGYNSGYYNPGWGYHNHYRPRYYAPPVLVPHGDHYHYIPGHYGRR